MEQGVPWELLCVRLSVLSGTRGVRLWLGGGKVAQTHQEGFWL